MTVTTFPYQGTLAELRRIRAELAEVQAERRELERQEAQLREHEAKVLHTIRTKSKGGK